MQIRRWTWLKTVGLVVAAAATAPQLLDTVVHTQRSSGGAAKAPTPSAGRGTVRAGAPKIDANLLQLMRGTLYPASNVIFAAQDDLGKLAPVADPSVSPNPLTSTYGGWQAVENAGLAIAEASNLIAVPGRMCSNGKPAPVQRADWVKFTAQLRQAGLAAYKAAQSKSTDAMVDVAGTVSDACAACHDVYREKKGGVQDRCLP
jgi:hypothetical protein